MAGVMLSSLMGQAPEPKQKVRTVTIPISIFTKKELKENQAEEYVQADRLIVKEDKEEHSEVTPPLPSPYDDSISYLIAVVSGNIKPDGLSALDTNITVVRILSAARESARTGKSVRP